MWAGWGSNKEAEQWGVLVQQLQYEQHGCNRLFHVLDMTGTRAYHDSDVIMDNKNSPSVIHSCTDAG